MRLKIVFEITDFQKHRRKNNNPKLKNSLEAAINCIVTIETEIFSEERLR